MVAGALLPVAIHKNKLYFLFGKERDDDDTPGWSDFGGGCEGSETPYNTAMREGGEELKGFLGDGTQVEKLIRSNGGFYKFVSGTYHIHVFCINYDENMPTYFNRNHRFLWERMDKKYLKETKLFEKAEIGWFTLEDMKKRRSEFRPFYQEIVGELLEEMPKINAFIRAKHRKHSIQTGGKKTRKNR